MVRRVTVQCYCGRRWRLSRGEDIACARCGFFLQVELEGDQLRLRGQKPVCRVTIKE